MGGARLTPLTTSPIAEAQFISGPSFAPHWHNAPGPSSAAFLSNHRSVPCTLPQNVSCAQESCNGHPRMRYERRLE